MMYKSNPQKLYKMLLTPLTLVFAISPFYIAANFQRKSSKVYGELLDEYTGDMSDEDLLKWEIQLNPSK